MSLVAWYKLDGNANDSSGNGNNGTASNVSWVDGKIAQSGSFDRDLGSDITLSSRISLGTENIGSLSFWAIHTNLTDTILFGNTTTNPNSSWLRFSGSSIYFANRETYTYTSTIASVPDGVNWHFYTFTFSSSKINCYIDGNFAGSLSITSPWNIDIQIFSWGGGTSYKFDGFLDDVRFYDHALSEKEVKELSKGKVLHYKFDYPYGEDGVVLDTSGYENNAELTESTAPRWIEEGIIGKGSYLFNGTTSGIERIGNFSDIKTISMWVNSQSIPTDSRVLLVHQPTGVGLGFYNNGYLVLSSSGNRQRTAIISGFKNNSWNHIAITYSDTKVPTCYINGVETTYSTTNYWAVPETTLYIGRRTSGNAFDGQIDDVRIYATALSADDVKELYQTKANLDKDGNMSVMNLNQIDTTNLEVKTNGILNSADVSEVGVSNGLVAWYPLDGNTRDYTEYRNDATNYGATISSGLDQLCYSFDGVDDYIGRGNTFNPGLSDFSMGGWIMFNSNNSTYLFSQSFAGGGNGRWWISRAIGTSWKFGCSWDNGGHTEYLSTVTPILNVWYCLFITADRDGMLNLYTNGVLSNSINISGESTADVTSNYPFKIGTYTASNKISPSSFASALIQDIRIYNRALVPEEIKILYELRKNKKTHFTHDNKVFIPGKFNEVY